MLTTCVGVPRWRYPLPEESAAGLMLHLSERNDIRSAPIVAERFGIRMMQLVGGEPAALRALAAGLRCPIERLCADTPVVMSAAEMAERGIKLDYKSRALTLTLRDVPISRTHLYGRDGRRACPACLAESRHHRFWWDLRDVTTCPRHGLKLVSSCRCGGMQRLKWTDESLFRCPECDRDTPDAMPHEAAEPSEIAASRYILSRFRVEDAQPVPMLDAMSFSDAVESMHRIGAAALEGYSEAWPKMPGIAHGRLLAAGFDAIAGGKMQSLLQSILDGYRKQSNSSSDPGISQAYGGLYMWFNFKRGRKFSELLADEFMRHAGDNLHLDGRTLLGDPEKHRRTYTLKVAAALCGLSSQTLRRHARELGLVRSERQNRVVFDAEKVTKYAADLKATLNIAQTCARLGVGEQRGLPALVKAGIITPAFKRAGSDVFRIKDVDDLVRRVLGDAPLMRRPTAQRVNYMKANELLRLPIEIFFRLILEKRLPVIGRMHRLKGIARAIVRLDDLREAVAGLSETEDVTPAVAATAFFTNQRTISVLVAQKKIQVTHGPGQSPLISSRSMREFRERFICLKEIAAMLGRGRNVTRRRLEMLGLKPDPELTKFQLRFYCREAVRAKESAIRAAAGS